MSRILAVEDDLALALGIEYALGREGFEVRLAKTLEEAKDLLAGESYDLLLLDVMLPDGSGYDLCSFVRKSSQVPVIFLTACDEEVNVVLGLEIGGDDYITKPFRVKELVSRIKAALRRSEIREKPNGREESEGRETVKSGGITIYPLEAKVEKNGSEIPLTAAEYKLLSLFIRNANRTLSRTAILDRLWDSGGDFVDDNTLSVYIRRLREKLESDPSNPQYILTVRGMGYKWNYPCG